MANLEKIKNIPSIWKDVTETYNPRAVKVRIEDIETAVQAFETKPLYPSMAQVRKQHSKGQVVALIATYIIQLDLELNLSRPLSGTAIDAISEDVYDMAYGVSFEELAFFFKQFRKGKHGNIYQGLNSDVICNGLGRFLTERANHFAQKQEDTSNMLKGNTNRKVEVEETFSIAELTAQMNLRDQINELKK